MFASDKIHQQVLEQFGLNAEFSVWAKSSLSLGVDLRQLTMRTLSYFMSNSARPDPDDLIALSRHARQEADDLFETYCLRAVTSAANPFIPGMNLCVALAAAAEKAQEGEKRSLISLQNDVVNLLLEIFERLPQTVRAFDGGMDGCSAVFEPEWARSIGESTGTQGPLSLALLNRKQQETFCQVPLIVDFLTRRFTRGLPDWRDARGVLNDPDELQDLRGGAGEGDIGLVLNHKAIVDTQNVALGRLDGREHVERADWDYRFSMGRNRCLVAVQSPNELLQGANARFPRLTFLPGVQFVVAGLVAKPNNYYRVPVVRMLLDLIVYLGMLAVLSDVLLFHEDGALAWGEYFFIAYVVVSVGFVDCSVCNIIVWCISDLVLVVFISDVWPGSRFGNLVRSVPFSTLPRMKGILLEPFVESPHHQNVQFEHTPTLLCSIIFNAKRCFNISLIPTHLTTCHEAFSGLTTVRKRIQEWLSS